MVIYNIVNPTPDSPEIMLDIVKKICESCAVEAITQMDFRINFYSENPRENPKKLKFQYGDVKIGLSNESYTKTLFLISPAVYGFGETLFFYKQLPVLRSYSYIQSLIFSHSYSVTHIQPLIVSSITVAGYV